MATMINAVGCCALVHCRQRASDRAIVPLLRCESHFSEVQGELQCMHDMHADMLPFRLNSRCPLHRYVPCFPKDINSYHRRAKPCCGSAIEREAERLHRTRTSETWQPNRWYTNHTIGSSQLVVCTFGRTLIRLRSAAKIHITADPSPLFLVHLLCWRSTPLPPLPQHPNVICKLSIGQDQNLHQQQLFSNAELIRAIARPNAVLRPSLLSAVPRVVLFIIRNRFSRPDVQSEQR